TSASGPDADVRLHDAPVIEDERVGDHQVEHLRPGGGAGRLAHAIADDLAPAELPLVTVGGEVALHLDEQIGVGQAHPVADGGPVEIGVLPPRQPEAHAPAPWKRPSTARRMLSPRRPPPPGPSVSALSPWTSRAPASSTRVTTFSSPGSKRTAVPAGTLSRIPNERARSKRSALFASKK